MIQATQPPDRGAMFPSNGCKYRRPVGLVRDAAVILQGWTEQVVSLLLSVGLGALHVADILLRRGNPLRLRQLVPADIAGHLVLVIGDDPRSAGALPEHPEPLTGKPNKHLSPSPLVRHICKIGFLSHGLAPVGDENYLIDSRLTAAVRGYRHKLGILQRARSGGAYHLSLTLCLAPCKPGVSGGRRPPLDKCESEKSLFYLLF